MDPLVIYFLADLVFMAATAYVAAKRGRNVVFWTFLAFLISIFALILVLFTESADEEAAFQRRRKRMRRGLPAVRSSGARRAPPPAPE